MPLGLLTSVALARLLGTENFGLYSVLINFATISVILSSFGWPSSVIYRTRGAGTTAGLVATTGLIAMSAVSIVVLIVGYIFEETVVTRLLREAPLEAYRLGLILIPIQLFGRLFIALARASDRFDLANRYQISVLAGTLVFLLGVWGAGDVTLVTAIASLLAAYSASVLWLGFYVLRLTGIELPYSARELLESFRYGLKSYAQSIAGQLHEQIDVLMLALFLVEPTQIAFYAVAVGVTNRLKMIPDALSLALFPHVASKESSEAGAIAAKTSRHSIAWVALTALVLAVVVPFVVPLVFGVDYEASVRPILVLLPGAAMLTTYLVLSRYFMAINKQGITIRTQLVSTTTNIGLNLYMIPEWGIMGAAASSLISYGLEMVLIVASFRKESGQGVRAILILNRSDVRVYRDRFMALLNR